MPSRRTSRGPIIQVPVVEADDELRIGRFGWKDQHASLVSFAGDAYLNEMGITNPFDGSEDRWRTTLWADRSPLSIRSLTRRTTVRMWRRSPNS